MPAARDIDVLAALAGCAPRRHLSPVAARSRGQALELAAAEGLCLGSFAFRIRPLEGPPGRVLTVAGEALTAPRLVPKSGTLTALACCVCTLGTGLERRVALLFEQGKRSLALALDSLGNEMLVELSAQLRQGIVDEAAGQGLTVAGELRSGDPGLALGTQAAVLRLAGADTLGVTAVDGSPMHPLKSISGVFGVGLDLPEAGWSRCDACKSAPRCGFVRQSAATA